MGHFSNQNNYVNILHIIKHTSDDRITLFSLLLFPVKSSICLEETLFAKIN